MKKFIDSVKALGEKMTGKEIEGKELNDIIAETADAYEGGGGTEVIANPELSGDEPNLEGLQVGDLKYAVPQGQSYTAGNGIAITDNVISVDYANADTEAF